MKILPTILGLFLLVLSTDAQESTRKKLSRYSIQSGMIEYTISDLSISNVKIRGKKSLYFKDFGALMLEEELSIITRTSSETKVHFIKKRNNTSIYQVDFFNNIITINTDHSVIPFFLSGKNMSRKNKQQLELSGKKIGTDKVLGYPCIIWQIHGKNKCLYKEQVPLWYESTTLGVNEKLTASNVVFNINIPDEKFDLPKFSITTLPSYIPEEDLLKWVKKLKH